MQNIFYVILVTLLLHIASAAEWSFNLPYYLLLGGIDANLDQPFREYVTKYDYPLEVHTNIQTEDGYLLTVFRIPYGVKNDNKDTKDKPVVLLNHGLLLSSEDFVVLGPEKSLGFILADRGYDVWFLNVRGTMHSRKHIKMDPTFNGEFWKFSFHEIGYYDLAATVDYILSTTKQQQIYYYGHSQGSSTFFILNSMRPEYNKRFKLMVALAPAVLLPHTKSILFRALTISDEINNLILSLGINELPHLHWITLLADTVCSVKGIPQLLCTKIHFYLLGGVSDQFNQTLVPNVMRYQYAGCAVRQGIHYAQGIKTDRFCQYDHGKQKNLEVYGSETPPDYNLTNVVVPIAYYYAKSDIVVPEQDQIVSLQLFPNIVDNYEVPYDRFTHIDMVVADTAVSFVYERSMKLMEKFK